MQSRAIWAVHYLVLKEVRMKVRGEAAYIWSGKCGKS